MKIQQILENLPLPTVIINLLNEEIMFINGSAEVLFDVSRKEIVGNKAEILDSFLLLSEGGSLAKLINNINQINEGHIEIKNIRDSKTYFCRYRIMVEDEDAAALCVFHEFVPTGDKHENSLKGFYLSAERSRELRSWLNSILGFTHLIAEESEIDKIKSLAQELNMMTEGIIKTLKITKDDSTEKRDTADANVPHLETLDIVHQIKEVLEQFVPRIKQKGIHLRFTSVDSKIESTLNNVAFKELLNIILSRAISSTTKGEVRIEISKKVEEDRQLALIKIIDTGIGIKKIYLDLLSKDPSFDDEQMVNDELFNALRRTQILAYLLRATLYFESQYSVGTTVVIGIPVEILNDAQIKERENSYIQISQPSSEGIIKVPQLLIVDDDQFVPQIIRKFLGHSCEIEHAPDGRRALMACSRKKFDLIFLDINLGIGLTGLHVIKQLRHLKEYEKTPVVAVTAYALPGDKERALEAGCNFYRTKPFTRADIITVFNRCLSLMKE